MKIEQQERLHPKGCGLSKISFQQGQGPHLSAWTFGRYPNSFKRPLASGKANPSKHKQITLKLKKTKVKEIK